MTVIYPLLTLIHNGQNRDGMHIRNGTTVFCIYLYMSVQVFGSFPRPN